MTGFFEIVLTFPVLLFALGFVLAVLYWLLVLVGAADLDLIDGLDGMFEGLDGAADALDGAVDGALDGAMDAAVDGAAEGAVDGAIEGSDGAAAAAAGFAPLLFVANLLRLGRIPLTISLTLFFVAGFLLSFCLAWLFLHFPAALPAGVFYAGSTVVSTAGAFVTTNLVCRPFEPMFKTHLARDRRSLLGKSCKLRTGRVDAGFGQAELTVDGDVLLISVRCDQPNQLGRGASLLLVSFDEERASFVVEPLHDPARSAPHRHKDGIHS